MALIGRVVWQSHLTLMAQFEKLVWSSDMVRDFWDYESRYPERYFTYQHSSALVRHLTPYLKDRRTLLDFGCGPGYLINEFLAKGWQAAGLDSSEEARRSVVRRVGGQDGFLGVFDLDQLLEQDLVFDAVTVIEVIEHLYDDQLDLLLRTLGSLLSQDGIVIFTTPNEEDLEREYILCPESRRLFHRWQHVRSWSRESLSSHLEGRDYRVIDCHAMDFRSGSRGLLWNLKRKFKDQTKPGKKPPNLLAVATPTRAQSRGSRG